MIISDEKIIIYHSIKRRKTFLCPVDAFPPNVEEPDQQRKRNTRVKLSSDSFVVAGFFFIEFPILIDV